MKTLSTKHYHRIRLKTAKDLYLNIANSGFVDSAGFKTKEEIAGMTETTKKREKRLREEQYSRWLFIPTGDGDQSYWILNEGAQGGRGQAMAIPDHQKLIKQWDLDTSDPRQKFVLKESVKFPGFYNILRKGTNLAVSSRWRETAFEWDLNTEDDQQCFALEQSEEIERDDILPGYLYWNYDNNQISAFCIDLGFIPSPQLLDIDKLIFYNNTGEKRAIAVHRFGCAGERWRDGKPQCAWKELAPGEEYEFEVSDYLKNSEQTWSLIAIAAGVAASAILIAVSLGTATPGVVGAWTMAGFGATGWITGASIVVLTAQTVPALANTLVAGGDKGNQTDEVYSAEVLKETQNFLRDKGITDTRINESLTKHLGETYFWSDGEVFEKHTQSFYLEETENEDKITEMFFGRGKCFFVLSDRIN